MILRLSIAENPKEQKLSKVKKYIYMHITTFARVHSR